MNRLTARQSEVLEFIRSRQKATGSSPSMREIAGHFGFSSMTAAVAHVRALRRKGAIVSAPRQARSLQVSGALGDEPEVVHAPIYGSIPAGWAALRQEEKAGALAIDAKAFGISRGARIFALIVRGDSMAGRSIVDGDWVVLEQGRTPRAGDVVAALIDGESTLKTFVVRGGKALLQAENPNYPELLPADELVIQGVMVGLVRRPGPS